MQHGAVEHRLQPDLHAADQGAGDGPAEALRAAVGHDLEVEVRPQRAPRGGVGELGGDDAAGHGEERLVHDVDATGSAARDSVIDRRTRASAATR